MADLKLEGYKQISIEAVVKAMGVEHVTVIKPYKVKKSIEAIREAKALQAKKQAEFDRGGARDPVNVSLECLCAEFDEVRLSIVLAHLGADDEASGRLARITVADTGTYTAIVTDGVNDFVGPADAGAATPRSKSRGRHVPKPIAHDLF